MIAIFMYYPVSFSPNWEIYSRIIISFGNTEY